MDSASVLQHPRRNLGSRHRSQADRFVKLAKQDPSRESENLAWAEQNAQQAVLYDFTAPFKSLKPRLAPPIKL